MSPPFQRTLPARTPGEVQRIVGAAGLAVREVVFTDNRRTMASLAAGGKTLRLQAAFATAPDAVLQAVARLFSSKDGGERKAARAAVRAFLKSAPLPATTPREHRRRARKIRPGDRPYLERLQAEFERINREHFDGQLPTVPLFLSGRMRRRNGHFTRRPLEIVVARQLCTHAEPGEAERTLRHEMIHLWQHVSDGKLGHGDDFRAWASRLDVHPRATRDVKWTKSPVAGLQSSA